MGRPYTCFRCRFCRAHTAGQECLARSSVIDVVFDYGQLVQPFYISFQCRFCHTHDAGQECLARSSAHVLLTYTLPTSLFAMFLCLLFRAASGLALPLRSGATRPALIYQLSVPLLPCAQSRAEMSCVQIC